MLLHRTIDWLSPAEDAHKTPVPPDTAWHPACTAHYEDLQSAYTAIPMMVADLQLPIFDPTLADAIWHGGCPGPCILQADPEAPSRPVYSMRGSRVLTLATFQGPSAGPGMGLLTHTGSPLHIQCIQIRPCTLYRAYSVPVTFCRP